MKKIVYGWFASIAGILLGGLLLCFPQILPFAAVLLTLSGICFVVTGVPSIFVAIGYFND